jgi:hypothetical protein
MSIDKSEKVAAKKLGGRLTRASGAICDDADIKCEQFIIESKRRESNQSEIIFYPKFWEKLLKQAVKCRKRPVYMWHTGGKCFVITYEDDILGAFSLMKRMATGIAFPYKEKVNFRFLIDDFENATATEYRNGYQPYGFFFYKKIPMALIDFTTFKEIVEFSRRNA